MWILISTTTTNFFTSQAYIFKAKAKNHARNLAEEVQNAAFSILNHGQADRKGKTPVWIFEHIEMFLVL